MKMELQRTPPFSPWAARSRYSFWRTVQSFNRAPRRPMQQRLWSIEWLVRQRPNKRLKLAGADRSKGSGVFTPWRATDCVPHPCAGGRVARSLSASR